MEIITKLDELGKPAWIGLLVLSFIVYWPIGLALLAFLIWSGRMGRLGCHRAAGRWHRRAHGDRWYAGASSSGNAAFDEYREETLRRLEEEQREFKDFLERLRRAKDKEEFDQFMAERRSRRSDTEGEAPEA